MQSGTFFFTKKQVIITIVLMIFLLLFQSAAQAQQAPPRPISVYFNPSLGLRFGAFFLIVLQTIR